MIRSPLGDLGFPNQQMQQRYQVLPANFMVETQDISIHFAGLFTKELGDFELRKRMGKLELLAMNEMCAFEDMFV